MRPLRQSKEETDLKSFSPTHENCKLFWLSFPEIFLGHYRSQFSFWDNWKTDYFSICFRHFWFLSTFSTNITHMLFFLIGSMLFGNLDGTQEQIQYLLSIFGTDKMWIGIYFNSGTWISESGFNMTQKIIWADSGQPNAPLSYPVLLLLTSGAVTSPSLRTDGFFAEACYFMTSTWFVGLRFYDSYHFLVVIEGSYMFSYIS